MKPIVTTPQEASELTEHVLNSFVSSYSTYSVCSAIMYSSVAKKTAYMTREQIWQVIHAVTFRVVKCLVMLGYITCLSFTLQMH